MTVCPESRLSCDLEVLKAPPCSSCSTPRRLALSNFVTDFVLFNGLERNDLFEKKLTIRDGVTSRGTPSGRTPSTGVVGALPLLQAFSYDVSKIFVYYFINIY